MGSSRRRSLRAFLALVALALVAGLATYSAFSDLTESSDNAFESGYLSIAGLTGEALFDVENVANNESFERCITVTNDGTIEYDSLEVFRSAAANHTTGNDSLAEDVTMTVERLDGPAVDTAAADCTAFDAVNDAVELDALTGDLTADEQLEQDISTPAADRGDLDALKTPGDAVSYKVTAHAAGMVNDDMNQAATGIKLRFTAGQGDSATPAAPVVVTEPQVTGTSSAQQGETLSVEDGSYDQAPASIEYQWQQAAPVAGAAGETWTDIPGATQKTFTLTAQQAGKIVRAKVAAINAAGRKTVTYTAPSAIVAPSAEGVYRDAVMQDSPYAFYELDDADHTTASDSSGNSRTLAAHGSGITASQAGMFGSKAFKFANAGYMASAAPFVGQDNSAHDNYTIEAWAAGDGTNAPVGFVAGAGGYSGCHFGSWLLIEGDGSAQGLPMTACGAANRLIGSSVFPSATTTWHHLVFVRDAGVNTLYVDGVAQATNTAGPNITTGHFTIGGTWGYPYYFTGMADNVAFYNKPLAAPRVLAHFQAAA